MKNKSYLTAIKRNCLSAPATWLEQNHHIDGRVLDYGCGRGDDAYILAAAYDVDSYDPFWRPQGPVTGTYDTILCTYVLNVIPDVVDRFAILKIIDSFLNPSGSAFISVRNDKRRLRGWTERGTWQGLIKMNLPCLHNDNGYRIYLMGKDMYINALD